MRLVALDLSLTATGVAFLHNGWTTDQDINGCARATIKTPARKKGEDDFRWSLRRYQTFSQALLAMIGGYRPDVLVVEVSSVVFGSRLARGRYGPGAQYRAGQGLGHALGWLDGVIAASAAYGFNPEAVVFMSTSDAKASMTGNRTADKDTVRAKIEEKYVWNLKTWDEAQVDALAVALAYLKGVRTPKRATRPTSKKKPPTATPATMQTPPRGAKPPQPPSKSSKSAPGSKPARPRRQTSSVAATPAKRATRKAGKTATGR